MSTQPTAVLVHGAFADASGFAGVIRRLQAQGVPVRAPMNPLRGLASDAEAIRRYTTTIEGTHRPRRPLVRWRRHLPGCTHREGRPSPGVPRGVRARRG